MLAGAGVPAQRLPLAQPAAALGAMPARVKVGALGASHLVLEVTATLLYLMLRDRAGR